MSSAFEWISTGHRSGRTSDFRNAAEPDIHSQPGSRLGSPSAERPLSTHWRRSDSPLAGSASPHEDGGMNDLDRLNQAEGHLRHLWAFLLQERQSTLARLVEGILAELTDDALDPRCRLQGATTEWASQARNPRGLSDFGMWREDEGERLSQNRAFEAHRQTVDSLLADVG